MRKEHQGGLSVDIPLSTDTYSSGFFSAYTRVPKKPDDSLRVQADFLVFDCPAKGLTYLNPQYMFADINAWRSEAKDHEQVWVFIASSWQDQAQVLPGDLYFYLEEY